ncbi:hypothetical protein HMPREF9713_00444 [Myroides odoratimimus CCUG 12700]|nr:hypothetical protein HMPREF9713_00444 [Myroides odoratimimus CCUG 12700]
MERLHIHILLMHFNTYMVQLKVPILRAIGDLAMGFQYLYGAVKSELNTTRLNNSYKFQYLYGVIKREQIINEALGYLVFQFLYGAVKRLQGNKGSNRFKYISIPMWCS